MIKAQFDEGAARKRMETACNMLGGVDRRGARLLVGMLFDPKTPTYLFSLRRGREIADVPRLLEKPCFFELALVFREIIGARGYIEPSRIWTGQEHMVAGSSDLKKAQYAPVALFECIFTFEEVKRARELSLIITGADNALVGLIYHADGKLNEASCTISLEMLGVDGKTARDPRAIDRGRLGAALREGAKPAEALDFADMKLEKRGDFPYART